MNVLAIDTENTTSNKGNPFDTTNRSVCYSYCLNGEHSAACQTTESSLRQLQELIDDADLLVLFNAKYDLHWFNKLGVKTEHKPIWCCQLAEFVIERQSLKYPSLEGCAIKYGLGNKIDVIKTEYWDKGINTDEIPWEILEKYAVQDAILTYKLYEVQRPQLTGNTYKLFRLQCADLRILEGMEREGLVYDPDICEQEAQRIESAIQELQQNLESIYPDVPINFGSPIQLSAFLFGGTIEVKSKVHDGFYKTGAKAGQPKYRNVVTEHQLPKMYDPIGKPLKTGAYSTSEDTLRKLKGNKRVVNWLLELSKLDKLLGTYYRGYPKLNSEMHWPMGKLHGQFNQVVAATGRLSSTRPNLQNIAGDVQKIFVSRFND